MTTTDLFDGHDGPICDRCELCEDCCICPDGPPLWFLLTVAWGCVALYALGLALGAIDFSNGWAFVAGSALFLIANKADDHHWAFGLAVWCAGAFGWSALTPPGLLPPFMAGALTPLALGALVFALILSVTRVQLWRDQRATQQAEDDVVAAEAERGLELIDGYLSGHTTVADLLSPASIAAAADDQRRIIGLSGYAGAGKDTVAAELLYNRDPEYTRVSFADPIRDLALAVNDDMAIRPGEFGYERFAALDGAVVLVPMQDVLKGFGYDWTEAKKVPAVRKHLQGLGAGCRFVFGEDVWVDTAMERLPEGPIVVTDCRFPNEALAIKDAGGYVVRVTRPGVEAVNDHITEVALDDWDFDAHVYNEGTPAEAREQMTKVEDLLYDPDLAAADTV